MIGGSDKQGVLDRSVQFSTDPAPNPKEEPMMVKTSLAVVAVLFILCLVGCGGETAPGLAPDDQAGKVASEAQSGQLAKVVSDVVQPGASTVTVAAVAASKTSAQYLPLRVNNIWRYSESVPGQRTQYFKCRVIGTSTRHGTLWYPICWGEGGDAPQTIYYQHNAQGMIEASQREADTGAGSLAIKNPPTDNQLWTRGSVTWYTCSASIATVVPAGTYKNCLLIAKLERTKYTYRWYAPRTGIVRQETYDWNGRLIDRVVLQSCTLVP